MSKNAEGWIRHNSKQQPVDDHVEVEIRTRGGDYEICEASGFAWNATGEDQITAYRLRKPAEQVEPVREPVISFEDMRPGMTVRFVRYTECIHRHWGFAPGKMYSVGGDKYSAGPVSDKGEIPSKNWGFEFALVSSAADPAEKPKRSEIVSQLQQECAGLVESASSLNQEGPLQWRDRITEIDATTQALTAERAELVQKLASEGFALIGRAVEPVEDYGNIQIGDLVSVISIGGFSDCTGLSVGDIAEVTSVDNDESLKTVSGGSWGSIGYNYKFHSRPSA